MDAAPRTRREKVENRERAILEAAREVFIEHGFDGARVAEIGRRAGIAEGTVYLYYRTKSDLMEGVLGAFWSDLTEGARDAISGERPPGEQLKALATYHLDRLVENYAFLDLAGKLRQWRNRDPARRADTRRYAQVFDEVWRRCVDRGLANRPTPVWVARDMFFGTLEYSARTILQGDGRASGDVVENLVSLMIGLGDDV